MKVVKKTFRVGDLDIEYEIRVETACVIVICLKNDSQSVFTRDGNVLNEEGNAFGSASVRAFISSLI